MDKRYMDSPLDIFRNGKMLRAQAMGLTPPMNSSLEVNQSFPRLSRKLKSSVSKIQLSKLLLNPEGMNGISFSSTHATLSSFHTKIPSQLEDSLDVLSIHEDVPLNPNPHKGVITLDIKTSQILITNTIAAKMLGYSTEELLELKFRDLIIKEQSQLALPDMIFNEKGEAIVFNGKVVEVQCKDSSRIAVSFWLTKAENTNDSDLYVAVIEPVQRVVSHLLLDELGSIIEMDDMALSLFHCTKENFVRSNISRWIPNIMWPSNVSDLDQDKRIQKTTGSRSIDSKQSFPLMLRLEHYDGEDSVVCVSDNTTSITPFYSANIWVFTNMSGMLLVTGESLIIDCNPVFVQLALGYTREQLIGKELGEILIDFSELRYGHHQSEVHHEDGSFIPISYFVNGPVEGTEIYQIWMAIASPASCNKSLYDMTKDSEVSTVSRCEDEESNLIESDMCSGEYLQNYQFVKQIGSGGFGCVHLAVQPADNKLVITKFIKKSKVYRESWIDQEDGQRLPLEIYFLSRIQHDHIVKMINYYENDSYFQLVMEKHGSGMDLFEFIEKTNGVPEPLAAYISKQLVKAVSYLHSQGILHRDIKDENVVLDDQFHAKLIDFGSAAFLTESLFSAFCGTFEYCSPEVLKGNPYRGPELEVWAMGTTIYIINFARNPFNGIEEILKNTLEIPKEASSDLKDLLNGMMDPDVDQRFCVQDVLASLWLNQPVCLDDYDFYDVCDLSRSKVEFQNSRYIVEDSHPVVTLTTSTPYKASPSSDMKKLDHPSFDIQDDSVYFHVPELVFSELSLNQD